MMNTQEKKIENIIEENTNKKTDNKHEEINNDENDNLIKQKLIQFLENQLKESEEKIIEKKIESEKEIMTIVNRLNKDIEKTRKFSLEKIIVDFLPIVDNIERALNLIEKNKSNEILVKISEQLNTINSSLKQSWKQFNIKKINDINVSFNPDIHQAMSIHYTNEIESNKIVTVMQSGYILNKLRLLRPAMVIVSKNKI